MVTESLPAKAPDPPVFERMLDASASRKALAGFLLSGLLLSLLGALLPGWGHHLSTEYTVPGLYFFSLSLGLLVSAKAAGPALRRGVSATLTFSASLACVSLLFLAGLAEPVQPILRMGGLFALGLSGGVLNRALFQAITEPYRHDPAATVNLAGAMFGLGCLLAALLVGGVFYVYTVGSILTLLAAIPGFYAVVWARSSFPPAPVQTEPTLRQAFRDFRSAGAVLFSLLLFFQFGNEWSVASWLPLFLIQRLGISPATSLALLALYWSALLVGRALVQGFLPRVSHGRLLLGSVLGALFGCTILTFTNNLFGAVTAVLFVGGGFAAIYPLVVEKIGRRFPYYHPGFFNGIFSFALTGGLLAPGMLSFAAEAWGIGVVMLLPFVGSVIVFSLLLLIWLEAKLSSGDSAPAR